MVRRPNIPHSKIYDMTLACKYFPIDVCLEILNHCSPLPNSITHTGINPTYLSSTHCLLLPFYIHSILIIISSMYLFHLLHTPVFLQTVTPSSPRIFTSHHQCAKLRYHGIIISRLVILSSPDIRHFYCHWNNNNNTSPHIILYVSSQSDNHHLLYDHKPIP